MSESTTMLAIKDTLRSCISTLILGGSISAFCLLLDTIQVL